jgi:hypothetical protein
MPARTLNDFLAGFFMRIKKGLDGTLRGGELAGKMAGSV